MTTVLDLPIPHVLRTKREYEEAVAEIDRLLDEDPQASTPDHDRLELLSVLVESYEADHDPIREDGRTPQDVVDFMLGQRGMTRGDLADVIGGKSRVSEFFAGKRPLSRTQIAALRDALGIPADLLL
ncbi:MAG: hypothetical protein JWM27_4391 [Gemmatimonadetes bacterium]|nr:hypothetical protein [Gemmatimonadota bacterium]